MLTATRGAAGDGQGTVLHGCGDTCDEVADFTWGAWGNRRGGCRHPPWPDVGTGFDIMVDGGDGVADDGDDGDTMHADARGARTAGAAEGSACYGDGCIGDRLGTPWGTDDDVRSTTEGRRGNAVSHRAIADGARGDALDRGLPPRAYATIRLAPPVLHHADATEV